MNVVNTYRNRLYRWREKSPLYIWRNERGYNQHEAAAILGLHINTYVRYECGNSAPRRMKAGVFVGVQTAMMKDRIDILWDEWMKPRTGVSLVDFMAWMMERPKIERC